jgi:hypothetical protein
MIVRLRPQVSVAVVMIDAGSPAELARRLALALYFQVQRLDSVLATVAFDDSEQRRQPNRLPLTMADFGAHAALLTSQFAPPLAGFLGSHI